MGNRAPGGSYFYINTWLNVQASHPLKFPDGFVKAIFDNNQKVGRTYMITGTNTVPTSVMTSHLWVTLDPDSTVQSNSLYKPENWMWSEKNPAHKQMMIDFFTTSSPTLRETRDRFISTCIRFVKAELGDSGTDRIDKAIQTEKEIVNEKHCVDCGSEADPSFRVCRNCGGKLLRPHLDVDEEQSEMETYGAFEQCKSSCPNITCTTGEPDFVNPNSYENIIQVLQNISYRAGIEQYGGHRKWIFVECDGLPYNTMRDIMENVWRCVKCRNCFYQLSSFNDHKCKILFDIEPNENLIGLSQ